MPPFTVDNKSPSVFRGIGWLLLKIKSKCAGELCSEHEKQFRYRCVHLESISEVYNQGLFCCP